MTISGKDSYKFKSRGLDTSLRINATLSMTKICGLPRKFYEFAGFVSESRKDGIKNPVILSLCKRRSIHFSDLKPKAIRGLYTNLNKIRRRFAHFGLLWRFVELPRNDEVDKFVIAGFTQIAFILSLRGLCPKQSTPHTPLKESKCKLKS